MRAVISLAVLAWFSAPAAAQVTIDTRTGGTATNVPFGQLGEVPDNFLDDDKDGTIDESTPLQRNHTVGQTFTVTPGDTRLSSFNLTYRDGNFAGGVGVPEPPVSFRAYVMAWDAANSRPTGPVLFESGVQTTVEDGADQTISFSGLALDFSAGEMYVAFLTQEGFGMNAGNNYFANVRARDLAPEGTYAGGTLVTKSNGTESFGSLTSEPWAVAPDRDAEFSASFTPVPEPGALLLGVPFAVGWVAYWRRRWQVSGGISAAASTP